MARISYNDGNALDAAELVERIRSGRHGALINVYRLLLHSPPLAATWFDHFNAVRWQTRLDGRLREIVTIRIGYLNDVPYVINQHVPRLALAEGMTMEECDALADWERTDFFSPAERAALAMADEMTRDADLSDSAFEQVRQHFDERRIVELAVLIGSYNMHTRVMKALRIDLEPKQSP